MDIRDEAGVQRKANCEESLCLGCGVCYSACKFGCITMKPRPRRVFTPETTFDKFVAMAIERGKLANLVFDDPDKLSHRASPAEDGNIFERGWGRMLTVSDTVQVVTAVILLITLVVLISALNA